MNLLRLSIYFDRFYNQGFYEDEFIATGGPAANGWGFWG